MGKPVYHYPDFIRHVRLKRTDGKRYWLQMDIGQEKTGGIVVILKNPSRANQIVSDKTVYNVASYIYQNRERFDAFKNIGTITILNLIPNYMTDSTQLQGVRNSLIDPENLRILDQFCASNKQVIIAWGNHPKGLFKEYEVLIQRVMKILEDNKNLVYYVDKTSLAGQPKHGQVWGYADELRRFNGDTPEQAQKV